MEIAEAPINLTEKVNIPKTKQGIITGIRYLALNLHQYQQEPKNTRSNNRCIAFQQSIAETMQDLGFEAHVETNPDADVDYQTKGADSPRGHAIGFIRIKNENTIIGYDASIDQSSLSKGQEVVRFFMGNDTENELKQSISICDQLNQQFGGDWDPLEVLEGLDINEKV